MVSVEFHRFSNKLQRNKDARISDVCENRTSAASLWPNDHPFIIVNSPAYDGDNNIAVWVLHENGFSSLIIPSETHSNYIATAAYNSKTP